ncbi:flagellar hook assembly protein FlgD [soil metagenome]
MTVDASPISSGLMAAVNPAAKGAKAGVTEIQDRFMTLLVAQMKNQDPMNPLDNAQVTSQLAQLSTVTGVDKLNTTLEALKTDFQSNQSLQATSMIGHGVLVPGSKLNLVDGKSYMGVELGQPADSVKVTIKDGAGNVVHTMDLGATDAGLIPIQWDGKTDAGTDAPDGAYKFEISATRAGQKVTDVSALQFGVVASVATRSTGVKLSLPGIGNIELSEIKQIL